MFRPPFLLSVTCAPAGLYAYLAACIIPSIALNENLFSRFSQNEIIAQTVNSVIQVLQQQH